ncbi:MAG TPA: response regulator [Desulfurivibrio alkaliphilus]|uniref:Sensory/regulatory protein RpfC n=1 Tax=Desulfurivibrio alkaliphilus TaxID=427923 RepID=A0A7C2XUF6_9BACT|nr:response regulator [Desulfurivibrio alkaliphilus]
MVDSGFDQIFADLIDELRPRELFLRALSDIVPGGGLLLLSPGGERLREGVVFELDSELEEELAAAVAAVAVPRQPSGPLPARRVAAGWLYAFAVPEFNAALFWWLPGKDDLGREPAGAALLVHALHYALRAEEREEEVAQEEQYRRQIEVLKRQHGELIEDNYRQYRINQEREQGYARNLEREIARQTAELREANARLEEISRHKSEFLANMSHELRTPMNAIIGFAELLADTPLNGEQDEYCRTIRQASASLLAQINDILDLAKIEAGKLELSPAPFNLDELLAGVTAIFALAVKAKGIDLSVHRDPDLPVQLLADSHRLHQVLLNLLGNAVKFTERGGVELRVERAGVGAAGGSLIPLRFVVRDSGIGIPASRLQAVFEKFTQADGSTTRRFGGTGLGLAISKQLVELMGGSIRVESREGLGSTFSFVISLAPAAQVAPDKAPRQPVPAATAPFPGGGRILLVEDNPVNRRLASLLIGKLGYAVVTAVDGVEGLKAMRENRFDLVLMDVQMPRMDGITATHRIRALENDPAARGQYVSLADRCSPLPIVGLTAHARKEDEESCYAAGMSAFLSKPIDRNKMAAILERLLAGQG